MADQWDELLNSVAREAISLENDIRLILNPKADADGHLLHDEELLAATEQSVRTVEQIEACASSLADSGYPDGQVASAVAATAKAMHPLLEAAVRSARTAPDYVEDFFIALGPHLPSLERAHQELADGVKRLRDRTARGL